MKQIIAIIQPDRLNDLRASLLDAGVCGLTVSQVSGQGCGSVCALPGNPPSAPNRLQEMSRLEILVGDESLDWLIDTILTTLNNPPYVNSGKIFVCNPQDIIRIRTGEAGIAAVL